MHRFSIKKMHMKTSYGKWRSFGLGLNVLVLMTSGEWCAVIPFNFCRITLQWHHNGGNGVSNHRRLDCLLNRLFRRRSNKTSKLCVTGLCEGNSPVTCEFLSQRARNAENVSIWWCHYDLNIWCPWTLQVPDLNWIAVIWLSNKALPE